MCVYLFLNYPYALKLKNIKFLYYVFFYRRNKDTIEDPPIYNMVSSSRNPITWLYFFTLCYKFWPPTVFAVWYPFITIDKNRIKVRILKFLWHYLPALIIDSTAQVFGKQTG